MNDAIEPDIKKVTALVEESLTPTSFNFAEAVLDRDYPEIEVPIYLDERSVQKMLVLEAERSDLEVKIAKAGTNAAVEDAERFEAIDKMYNDLVHSLRSKRYVARIKGISPERMMELDALAHESFPKEFEETPHPLSGSMVSTEKESPEREDLFGLLLRREHLVSVTAPDGSVDSDWNDLEKLKTTWGRLPLVARKKINAAIHESTIAVDYYRELADEVF